MRINRENTSLIGFKNQFGFWFVISGEGDSDEPGLVIRKDGVKKLIEAPVKWKRLSELTTRKRSARGFGSHGTVTAGGKADGGIVMGADSRAVYQKSGKIATDEADKLYFLPNGIGVLAVSGNSGFAQLVRDAANIEISDELSKLEQTRLHSTEIKKIIESNMNSIEEKWNPDDHLLRCTIIVGMYDYSDKSGDSIPVLFKLRITKGTKTIIVEHKSWAYGGCYNPPKPSYLEANFTDNISIEDGISIVDIFVSLAKHDAEVKAVRLKKKKASIGGRVRICVIQPRDNSRSVFFYKKITLMDQDLFDGSGFRFKVDLGELKNLKKPPATFQKANRSYKVDIDSVQKSSKSL